MRSIEMLAGTLVLIQLACGRAEAGTSNRSAAAETVAAPKKLYLDVHDLSALSVTAADVANAHAKDLALQGQYGVDFKAYFFDERAGKVYCLAEAPSPEATRAVHAAAHGLVADKIIEVSAGAPASVVATAGSAQ